MSQAAVYGRMGLGNDYDRNKLQLEFEGGHSVNSKRRRLLPPTPAQILQSPDLKMLKLGSPELERLIINNNGFLPTPSTPAISSSRESAMVPTSTTNGQVSDNRLSDGFMEALQKLQQQDNNQWSESVSPIPGHSQKQEPSSQDNDKGVVTPVIQSRTFLDPPMQQVSPPLPMYQEPSKSIKYPTTVAAPTTINSQSNGVYRDLTTMKKMTPTPAWMPTSSNFLTTSYVSNSPLMIDQIKTEDDSQIVPSMSAPPKDIYPADPINLVQQEHIKHERKKMRNRLAAQRCRKRKIEREDTLKDKVTELKDKNADLTELANKLKNQVCELKEQVMKHVKGGCNLYIKDECEVVDSPATNNMSDFQIL